MGRLSEKIGVPIIHDDEKTGSAHFCNHQTILSGRGEIGEKETSPPVDHRLVVASKTRFLIHSLAL